MKELVCIYPFDNKKYEVNIAVPGEDFAHDKFPESRYAVDFLLPLETPIRAVKSGTVIVVKHDSDVHYSPEYLINLTEEYLKDLAAKSTNLVSIQHGNGTFAEYCHLSTIEVVSINQSVEMGDVIGYTGMSGIMDLEHLHFNAFARKNGKFESIPVKFVE